MTARATPTTDPTNALVRALRNLLGMRRHIRIGEVTYIERTPQPLQAALAAGQPKIYDALFRGSPPMRIRVAHDRLFPDLTGTEPLEPYRMLLGFVQPGQRVLDLRCRSGYGAAILADLVGPSGGVVATDTDHEFIRYAKRRYPVTNLGFENGGIESLAGELNGAFDVAVLAINPPTARQTPQPPHSDEFVDPKALAELWRVTSPGGLLVLLTHTPRDSQTEQAIIRLLRTLPNLANTHLDRIAGSDAASFVAHKRPNT